MTETKFKIVKQAIAKHFYEMVREADALFTVNVSKDEMWDLYLNSFPDGTNNIFRERREYDCNACRHFINRVGNVIVIKDGVMHTIWEVDVKDNEFSVVCKVLD